MPRPLRLEYGGALYHLMSRGDRREDIFVDDRDRENFLGLLGRTCAKTGWLSAWRGIVDVRWAGAHINYGGVRRAIR
jgi:hypothetical protein